MRIATQQEFEQCHGGMDFYLALLNDYYFPQGDRQCFNDVSENCR